jgi:hypothetical protein
MPPKAAAIPTEALRPRLSNTQLTAQDIRSVRRSEAWNEIDSRNAETDFLVEFAQTECNIPLDSRTIADLFQLTTPRVHEIRCKAQTTRKPPPLTPSLTLDQKEGIRPLIVSEASRGNFLNHKRFL